MKYFIQDMAHEAGYRVEKSIIEIVLIHAYEVTDMAGRSQSTPSLLLTAKD